MNAVIALCHFCEIHGPSVLFCTQAFHDDPVSNSLGTQKDASRRSSQSSASNVSPSKSSQPKSNQCEACRSIPPDHPGFLSVDKHTSVSYSSSRNPAHHDVYVVVRQACVRSLSCEICPGREGPIFFGEDANGYVLSHTFILKILKPEVFAVGRYSTEIAKFEGFI
ncbi:folliculin-like [Dendronephthya gigantea]|uniref:folliculin-like n=1 Tax=Dendronephthya gigantea TaxID=151771 RepID=UPI00106AD861|nr:folliculin-like [Dendronephthya gigantea]